MIHVTDDRSKNISRNVMAEGTQVAMMYTSVTQGKSLNISVEIIDKDAAKVHENALRSAVHKFLIDTQELADAEGIPNIGGTGGARTRADN